MGQVNTIPIIGKMVNYALFRASTVPLFLKGLHVVEVVEVLFSKRIGMIPFVCSFS